jgi:hypothetical protein
LLGVIVFLMTSHIAHAQVIYTFEQGANGYADTGYTTILGSDPLSRISDWRIYGFGVPNNASQQVGLLQFNNIFGVGVGQVPLSGVTITSATLQFSIQGNFGGSLEIFPMLSAWNPSTVTDSYAAYNGTSPTAYWGGGTLATVGPTPDVDFDTALGVSVLITDTGTILTVDITNIAQEWQAGALANNGLALFGSGAFSGMFAFSPLTGAGNAPTLTIETAAVPEPSAWGMLLCGCVLLVGARRGFSKYLLVPLKK